MGVSALDKLLVFPAIPLIFGKTIAAAATAPILGMNGAPTYSEHVTNALVRAFLTAFSAEQFQWLLPKFSNTYQSYCTKNGITPDFCDINPGSGASYFWIGDKSTAKYTMVYVHGGGWVLPGSENHLTMFAKWIRWSGDRLAILCVAYTLAPEAPYPIALGQCVEGLRHVLEEPERSPSTVLLGGDSAGGNMIVAMLGHLIHPHPQKDVIKPIRFDGSLMGGIVISPWLSADTNRYKSFHRLAARDTFPLVLVNNWSTEYKGGNKSLPDDEYLWPAHASSSWWEGSKCGPVLCAAGEDEVLIDSIVDWTQKYRQGAGQSAVELAIGKKETHIAPLVSQRTDQQLLDLEGQTMEGAIKKWIENKLV